MTSSEPIEFDKHGDLMLQIGSDETQPPILFTVCSRTLARASPVFDRMLYGNFIESSTNAPKESKDWVVKLPEEKPVSLSIFLYISHAQFQRVPSSLPIDELYNLTILTHYYDSTRMLGPWVRSWVSSVEEDARESTTSMAKALWICWELGAKTSFVKIAQKLLMESEGPLDIEDPMFQDLQTPPDIIERIIAIQLVTIQALLDVFRDMVDHLIVVDEKPRWCRHAMWMGPHRCESMILGSMTFCLARAGLWPLPKPHEVEYSLVGLYRKLTNLVIHDIGKVPEQPPVDHNECNPGIFLLEEIEKVMGDIANPVTNDQLKHLSEQVKIFGL